jgi:hypothetical protein
LQEPARSQRPSSTFFISSTLLLALMAVLAGGAALRESATIDEVAHIGAGVSYLQKFDLRLNEEHPPLAKLAAGLPLVVRGTKADYSGTSWTASERVLPAFFGEWIFGAWLIARWNDPVTTVAWARLPMLGLTLLLGWVLLVIGRRFGGPWGGVLCLSAYVAAPVFLVFGPLVLTDAAAALSALVAVWTFACVWQEPTPRSVLWFGLGLAAALLSKFTAGVLFLVFPAFALSTRWLPLPEQPSQQPEKKIWRRRRWRATLLGILLAASVVYLVYLILSWNQPTESALSAVPPALRRLLLPPWLYLRGILLVAVTASRPTFILGHSYSHGVWFYFPVLLALKSPLGFLGLLAMALVTAVRRKASVIPAELAAHWRALWVSLLIFVAVCLLSQLDISFRHFSFPLVLLILLLAPLPHLLERRWAKYLAAGLAVSSLVTVVRAYPYFFPYLSPLGLGYPAYALMNDSNVDWNQGLPEARRFADRHGLTDINVDEYGFTDPSISVPGARIWNCQTPAMTDAGQWVVISANMILDAHNCSWLMGYPHEALAGGSMYAVRLPDRIPTAGSPGGPPLPEAYRYFVSGPENPDLRALFLDLYAHPDKLTEVASAMEARFQAEMKRHAEAKKR